MSVFVAQTREPNAQGDRRHYRWKHRGWLREVKRCPVHKVQCKMKLTLRTTTGMRPGLVKHLASQLYYFFPWGSKGRLRKRKKWKKCAFRQPSDAAKVEMKKKIGPFFTVVWCCLFHSSRDLKRSPCLAHADCIYFDRSWWMSYSRGTLDQQDVGLQASLRRSAFPLFFKDARLQWNWRRASSTSHCCVLRMKYRGLV